MTTTNEESVVLRIGRAQECDLVVAHSSVSAHHAELHQDGSRYRLIDLSSTNGTFVNGVRVNSQLLNDGDVVHVGPIGLEFRNGGLEIGIHDKPDPGESTPSDNPSTSRKVPLAVWVLALVAAAVVIVISLSSGGEGEKLLSASPVTTTASPVTTTASPVTTTASPVTTTVYTATQTSAVEEVDWEQLAHSVVLIEVVDCGGDNWTGSGTIVLDGGHVLTNHHVVIDDFGGFCELKVWGMESLKDYPVWVAYGEVIPRAFDRGLDLAVIRLVDGSRRPAKAVGRTPIEVSRRELNLGDEMKVLGFPGMGGEKLTMTPGEFSGWWTDEEFGIWSGEFYKTSAKMGPGVSGGAAFNAETGEFLGVPTGMDWAESNARGDILGLVRPAKDAIPLLDAAERAD